MKTTYFDRVFIVRDLEVHATVYASFEEGDPETQNDPGYPDQAFIERIDVYAVHGDTFSLTRDECEVIFEYLDEEITTILDSDLKIQEELEDEALEAFLLRD